jgi:hypothetical protein
MYPADPGWLERIVATTEQIKYCAIAEDLLVKVRGKVQNIPPYNPRASSSHALSVFSMDPSTFTELGDRPPDKDWLEYLKPKMDCAFGWGELDLQGSAHYVNDGKDGLEGFCRFFAYFIEERGLRGEQIRPYFQFLIAAIEMRSVATGNMKDVVFY